jgi:sigma-70-like protein
MTWDIWDLGIFTVVALVVLLLMAGRSRRPRRAPQGYGTRTTRRTTYEMVYTDGFQAGYRAGQMEPILPPALWQHMLVLVHPDHHEGSPLYPTAPELAAASQRSGEQVRALQTGTMPMMSLDTPIADGQSQLRDVIAERTFRNPLDTAIEMELSDHVMSCMQAPTPRDAYIVRARFGLDTGGGRTLEDIGQDLQLSRERVRQAFCRRRLHSFREN